MTNSGTNGSLAITPTRCSGCPHGTTKTSSSPTRSAKYRWCIIRIKTERSSATMPDTRTSHNISNVEVESERDGVHVVRFNWHTLSHRYKTNYSYFGMSRYVIDFSGETPMILNKYVVLKNDYINQVIDIYHI
jgi:3-phenylpropionate/cinnamic acid dioxygenase small subunit